MIIVKPSVSETKNPIAIAIEIKISTTNEKRRHFCRIYCSTNLPLIIEKKPPNWQLNL